MRKRIFFSLLLFLGPLGRTACDATAPIPEAVSLLQLIATPEKYDGKAVLVVGFLRLEFEGNCLYLHAEDYKHAITKNALWVEQNSVVKDNLNMHYVALVGTFDAGSKGHMGLNSGSLRNITGAGVWPAIEDFKK